MVSRTKRSLAFIGWAAAALLAVAVQRNTFLRRWLVVQPRGAAALRTVLPDIHIKGATFEAAAAEVSRRAGVPVTVHPDAIQILHNHDGTFSLELSGVSLGDALNALVAEANERQYFPLVVDAGDGQVTIRTQNPQSWPVTGQILRVYELDDLLPSPAEMTDDGTSLRDLAKREIESLADSLTTERQFAGTGGGFLDPTPYYWVGGRLFVLARGIGHQRMAEALQSMRATGQRPSRPMR